MATRVPRPGAESIEISRPPPHQIAHHRHVCQARPEAVVDVAGDPGPVALPLLLTLEQVDTLGPIATTSSSYVGSNTSYKWHSGGRLVGGPPGPGGAPISQWAGGTASEANGIFWRDSNLKESPITDGLSSTIMVGERRWGAAAGGSMAEAALALANSGSNEQLSVERSLGSAVLQLNSLNEDSARRSCSSMHAGFIMFLFCDGSVRPFPRPSSTRCSAHGPPRSPACCGPLSSGSSAAVTGSEAPPISNGGGFPHSRQQTR